MKDRSHMDGFQEGIMQACFIRGELEEHLTDYYPEKVRELNKFYFEVVRKIIKHGELLIDEIEDFEVGLKISEIVERYKEVLRELGE